jgi:hypothetical protein
MSDLLYVDLVVLGMGSNELYEECLGWKKHGANEAVGIPGDIEDDMLGTHRVS